MNHGDIYMSKDIPMISLFLEVMKMSGYKTAKISENNRVIINTETNLLVSNLKVDFNFDARHIKASIRKLHRYLITVMKDMKKNRDTDIDAILYQEIKNESRNLCSLLSKDVEVLSSFFSPEWCEIKIGVRDSDKEYVISGNYYI